MEKTILLTHRNSGGTQDEMADAGAWLAGMLEVAERSDAGPAMQCLRQGWGEIFSFRYGSQPSWELLKSWRLKSERVAGRPGTRVTRVTRTDPKTGLALICDITAYTRFPVVEWMVRLKNTSKQTTPIVEDLRSMDVRLRGGATPYLNHWTGDYCAADGLEPFRVPLAHAEKHSFAPFGGRGTNLAFPYYDIGWQDSGRGVIAVVGWPGQWASRIAGDDAMSGMVLMWAGQERTHFRLLPGEEARTPTALLMFYRGDRDRSRNLWRRWYRAHVMPRPGGKRLGPKLVGFGTDPGVEFTAATEENQKRYIGKWAKERLPIDVWWIDAGWYPCYDESRKGREWHRTGTWKPDPERFPNRLKPVSDCARKHGADFLLWFEPERVWPGTELDREHPEWLLKIPDRVDRLLNLGNPACRKWLTNHVCRLIRENGIRVYRQDFNFPPLRYWRENEAGDRQGMNENLHVQGYMRYWDDLLKRNPGLLIDSCASGGRRNDLDTMRRSVPLHYSDFGYGNHPVKLAFQDTMHQWLPYFKEFTLSWDQGTTDAYNRNTSLPDSYSFHCSMAPMLFPCLDTNRKGNDYALVRRMVRIWRRAAKLMLDSDYYALTPPSRAPDRWVARQFDSPETRRGFVQAIRLPQAPQNSLVVYPKAVRPKAMYVFENMETGKRVKKSGQALRQDGFRIALPAREGAVWFYRERVSRVG